MLDHKNLQMPTKRSGSPARGRGRDRQAPIKTPRCAVHLCVLKATKLCDCQHDDDVPLCLFHADACPACEAKKIAYAEKLEAYERDYPWSARFHDYTFMLLFDVVLVALLLVLEAVSGLFGTPLVPLTIVLFVSGTLGVLTKAPPRAPDGHYAD